MTKRIITVPGVLRKGAAVMAQLWRRDDAVAAVEFAFLGSTFLLLVCMTFELGMILFIQSVMDNALRDAARQIMTDQLTTSSAFITKVCGETGTLITNCSSGGLKYYVQQGTAFSGLTAQTAFSSNAFPTSLVSADDVLAQVAYSRTSLIPWAAHYLNNSNMIISTLAFQNEPF
jgi:Flp pilus assembly protein TadG